MLYQAILSIANYYTYHCFCSHLGYNCSLNFFSAQDYNHQVLDVTTLTQNFHPWNV